MKKLLIHALVLLSAGAALAGGRFDFDYSALSADTNATAVTATTNATSVSGAFYGLYVDLGGTASQTCTVSVATLATRGTGPAKTLFTAAGITADGWYFPRTEAVNASASSMTNSPVTYPMLGDRLVLTAYNASSTGVTATVYFYWER